MGKHGQDGTIAVQEKVTEGEIVEESHQLATEIRAQREMALSKPRIERTVLEGSLTELGLVPEFARKAYYVIPYKDGDKTVNVEGPSVKASRALMRRWGNCASASRVIEETDDRFQVEGVFVDFETNTIYRRAVSVSKFYVPRQTKIKTRLRDDRLTMALQAGMSKAERNATLAGLPVWLVESYYNEAKRIAGGGKVKGSSDPEIPAEKRYAKMYAAFKALGVVKEKIETYINQNLPDADDASIIGHMLGIHNAIKDGQADASIVFGAEDAPLPKGPVSVNDILGDEK